jgi:transglutaminase-like putative cysteine protease
MLAWVATIGVLIHRTYVQASSTNLATDLARYGSSATWRGIYYRGEKIGFTASQTVPMDGGFELQEDGRLQMSLMGATMPARIRTTARVDRDFALQSFAFSLDPGTGPVEVTGTVRGREMTLSISTKAGTRTETRTLDEPPMLSVNLPRRLAAAGLQSGMRMTLAMFDPATLRNAPLIVDVGAREVTWVNGVRMPVFKVEMDFGGLKTASWITDTGDVVREESPMGLVTVRETAERAQAMVLPFDVRQDMIEAAAVLPRGKRFNNPRDVRRITLRVDGVELNYPDLHGGTQAFHANTIELRDPRDLVEGPPDAAARAHLAPEPFIESDDPEIRKEAAAAVENIDGTRARAERLVRHVNAMLDKKPTVSLPSAREVLRTRVGDCNEHTALYVAMARAIGIPTRIAVGLTYMRGAFYYHAWPEVYIEERGRGLWLPVDPTLNQFPADTTHLRIVRGGLDKQTAVLPLIGNMRLTVTDLELAPGVSEVVVGQGPAGAQPLALPLRRRDLGGCWFTPAPSR